MRVKAKIRSDLSHSGEMIKAKLREVVCEYEEKINECGTLIDGVKLAGQLVG